MKPTLREIEKAEHAVFVAAFNLTDARNKLERLKLDRHVAEMKTSGRKLDA